MFKSAKLQYSQVHIIGHVVVSIEKSNTRNINFEYDLEFGDFVLLWSEFNLVLYKLSVEFVGKLGKEKCYDKKEVDFGMRKFHTISTSFAINEKKHFYGENTMEQSSHIQVIRPWT